LLARPLRGHSLRQGRTATAHAGSVDGQHRLRGHRRHSLPPRPDIDPEGASPPFRASPQGRRRSRRSKRNPPTAWGELHRAPVSEQTTLLDWLGGAGGPRGVQRGGPARGPRGGRTHCALGGRTSAAAVRVERRPGRRETRAESKQMGPYRLPGLPGFAELAEGVLKLFLGLAVACPVASTKRLLPLLPGVPGALGERPERGPTRPLRAGR